MPNIRLHHQVCAFIDVLGGAKLFRGKDRQRAQEFFFCLEVFEQRMNGWSGHFPKKRQTRALVKTFSDNIFVAFPLRSNPKLTNEQVVAMFLTELTDQIAHLTLMSGFPLRGAVTVGPLMFSEKFLFGPALVEAVELEKAAVIPRIMLSKSVLRHITPDSPYQSLVLRDADGSAFLDYLGRKALIPSAIKWHREFVQKGLAENASRVRERQKYEWLAQYHNFHAMKVGMLDQCVSIDHGIAFEPYGDEVDVISLLKQRREMSATGRSRE
ncbi:hypothetical protein [Burkholderia ubonensis]|uniref:hypothetical protein n=1 Tax=Burkholderia ubonensis TaxID=101571 RepID=UPI00076C69D8|nr:hypothetical protein [Burkholderia ubonensis]KVZ07618.1 hypothetical protein WL11_11010 [Burkholderia ubonensis]